MPIGFSRQCGGTGRDRTLAARSAFQRTVCDSRSCRRPASVRPLDRRQTSGTRGVTESPNPGAALVASAERARTAHYRVIASRFSRHERVPDRPGCTTTTDGRTDYGGRRA